MSDKANEAKLDRKAVLAGAAAAGAGLSLPRFLRASDALAAGDTQALDEAMADFLGQPDLPVPPASATVHTSACQFCNVGCGYKVYTWPVAQTPKSPNAGGPYPKGTLSDWISPAMVTRAQVGGVDSYVAVVPDKDCIVNKGDHSPRGGSNEVAPADQPD
jgi:anaerobic selenocysteine-containing dehydrogenase